MSSPPHPADALLQAVRVLYDAVDGFDAALAAELGVDRTALRAINAMEGGAVSPGELGRRLHLASGSVTALLDRLERAGHVERTLSGEDRRRRDARLTPGSRARASAHYRRLAETLKAAFSGQDEHGVARAAGAIASVAAAFNGARPAPAGGGPEAGPP